MKTILSSLAVAAAVLAAVPANAAYICTRDPNSSVNLRSAPSKQAWSKGQIPAYSDVNVWRRFYGNDGFTWLQVEYGGLVGFVRADYVCR